LTIMPFYEEQFVREYVRDVVCGWSGVKDICSDRKRGIYEGAEIGNKQLDHTEMFR